MNDFSSLAICSPLLEVLSELGLSHMTPIQARSIPLLLKGRDVVGQSQTGSGKTIAFGLPILDTIQVSERALQALILCPTRELCTQVAREIRKLGRRLAGLHVQILAGGQPIRPQIAAMANGVHIAVATPGRLLDHLRRPTLSLSRVNRLVLDEADRMLDMGFADDIREIISLAPKNRQTMFFSATFDSSIKEMSRLFQRDPVHVRIDDQADESLKIQQTFYQVEADADKMEALTTLLQRFNPTSALVFCRLRVTASELADQLNAGGLSATALHGDLEQRERDRAMARFRNQSTRVLVATDVAARGLDIVDLDLVVNFDLPSQPEIYLHRIGRTGRAGKTGLAWSLGLPREQSKLDSYEEETGSPIERIDFASHPSSQAARSTAPASMTTLHIWGGRKDKIRPGDILGALTGEVGMAAQDVGKIEIHDILSYVAVSAPLARNAAKSLREGGIKGRKFRVDLI